jgi:hypothetical protein
VKVNGEYGGRGVENSPRRPDPVPFSLTGGNLGVIFCLRRSQREPFQSIDYISPISGLPETRQTLYLAGTIQRMDRQEECKRRQLSIGNSLALLTRAVYQGQAMRTKRSKYPSSRPANEVPRQFHHFILNTRTPSSVKKSEYLGIRGFVYRFVLLLTI